MKSLLGLVVAGLFVAHSSAQITAGAGQGAVVTATRTDDRAVEETGGQTTCAEKWPIIKDIALGSQNLCSETCEKALYFTEYYDYQKCHSCCSERYEASLFAKRELAVCPEVEGVPCGGKGTCSDAGVCLCQPAWGGPTCQEERVFAYCHAVGDPHWRTFDGLYFNVYSTGEFLQYFDPLSDAGEAVVNYNSPYYTVAVNRGIAVRRKNEIVSVNWPTGEVEVDCVKTAITGGKITTKSGLTITKSGINTDIVSPSGLKVTVETNADWGQNLWLQIFGTRSGQYLGLCGNFDGQPANDDGWPASEGRQEPIAAVIKAVTVPDDASFFKCKKAAYTHNFGSAALTMIDYESPEIKTLVANTARVSQIVLRPELAAFLTPELADRLKNVYEVKCAGDRRTKSENACWGLLGNGAVRAIVDCIEDQCETGNAAFIGAAQQAAVQDLEIKQEIKENTLEVQVEQFKVDTGSSIKI